ncbi:MAG: LOG family protein [Chloroflexi bacterium]|nr:LOG family protein [Chloroflexota bacterium]MBP8057730.1 LOG family protein [Chloroflexota bacterium]
MKQPIISVFGSSGPLPGSLAYEEARAVGRLLAEAGYAVATGGYGGVMSAVSQGAAEAGGHVIGVTCAQIEQFRPLGRNQWVQEEIKYQTLQDRVLHLVKHNDGVITMPGGIGTLSEMALVWSFTQVGEISPRPHVLFGELWRATLQTFITPEYVRESHWQLLHFAHTPEEAVAYIKNAVCFA